MPSVRTADNQGRGRRSRRELMAGATGATSRTAVFANGSGVSGAASATRDRRVRCLRHRDRRVRPVQLRRRAPVLGPGQLPWPTVCSRSGVAAITYPAKSVIVSVPGGLTSQAMALAILQNTIAGVYVASAVPNAATGKLTVNLNKAPWSASNHQTAKVAWFVVN
jgi:hypothetical protein